MLCLSISFTNDGMGMPAISNVTFFCSSMAALYLTVYIQIAKAARRKSVGRPDKCFDFRIYLCTPIYFFGQRLSRAALPTVISSAENVMVIVIGTSLFASRVSE